MAVERVAPLLATASLVFGVAASADSDLAKQSQNPIANMISVPFESNLYFGAGPSDANGYILNVKPVIPVNLGRINLINRFVVPVIWLEGQDADPPGRGNSDLGWVESFPASGSVFGLGNITYEGFLSPAEPGPVTWGIGPALNLPTNTDDRLGNDAWSAGVAAVVLSMPGKWVLGGLVQNLWSFAKHGDAVDVNSGLFQPIVNYNIANGWYLTSVPVITANWEADSGQKWTVPVGGGVGKIHRFGRLPPLDLKLAGYYNAVKPDFGPDWSLQFTVKFLFPK